MHSTEDGRSPPAWMREALAGSAGAMAVVPAVLTLGLLAYSPLGAVAPQVGVLAGFVAASLGGAVHAVLSRTPLPVSGQSSPTTVTLLGLVAQLAADPRLVPTTGSGLAGIVALCGLALLLSGALQVAFAVLGMARLVRVVPQPVLAGFMNSAALLIALAQLPLLLNLPLGSPLQWQDLRPGQAVPLALGLGTAAAIWWMAHHRPRLPAALLGLLAGMAAHALASALWGEAVSGARIGTLATAWPWPPALLSLQRPDGLALLHTHAWPLLLTALALAVIGMLESALNLRAMDQLLATRHDPRRELIALGCGNIASGLFGGVPLTVTRARALATLQAGGQGRVAALVGVAVLGLLYLVGGPLLALLPLPVLAGVMLTVALTLADRWTGRLLSRWWAGDRSADMTLGLGLVALVVGTTLWRGMATGVGVGVLLSLVTFAVRMNRSLLHDRYLATARPSRRIYPAALEARLHPLRDGIVVFEVEGPLFFGSGDRLLDEADTLDDSCRRLVIDLRRTGAIDESGAVALQTLTARAAQRGIQVELAGLAPGSAPAQALRSFAPALPHRPDADRAIEAAELSLLKQAGCSEHGDLHAMPAVPLAESSLLAGLDPAQVATVAALLLHQRLDAGEALFAEGDPGDRLYVLSRGSVSILSQPDRLGRTQRYLSISPGMMIGETAMLDGRGRSAGAVADAASDVHALTLGALDALGRSHPELAIHLHRNVALHLSQRLRDAASAWRSSSLGSQV